MASSCCTLSVPERRHRESKLAGQIDRQLLLGIIFQPTARRNRLAERQICGSHTYSFSQPACSHFAKDAHEDLNASIGDGIRGEDGVKRACNLRTMQAAAGDHGGLQPRVPVGVFADKHLDLEQRLELWASRSDSANFAVQSAKPVSGSVQQHLDCASLLLQLY
eukprot:CAMPEP_0180570526 /NCGR_PEP_ID=MMETSP1037_2-20121125/8246_1 /TAXON_ID=632150 /ORGANISM="Azadinium spinosum, Strain 3D9" /LENGTH=163 /DNA_ID=CAMNT_0022587809 /DNA_START=984 /DNA_END=1475 /DNA_ORIENTATION=-